MQVRPRERVCQKRAHMCLGFGRPDCTRDRTRDCTRDRWRRLGGRVDRGGTRPTRGRPRGVGVACRRRRRHVGAWRRRRTSFVEFRRVSSSFIETPNSEFRRILCIVGARRRWRRRSAVRCARGARDGVALGGTLHDRCHLVPRERLGDQLWRRVAIRSGCTDARLPAGIPQRAIGGRAVGGRAVGRRAVGRRAVGGGWGGE